MVAKPLEAFKYLSDFHQMFSVQEKEKKIVLSFYFYFALILFDDVSTGWDMLSWMAISLHHMCLSQDSRVKWVLAGRELNTSTKKRKNYLLNSLLPAYIFPWDCACYNDSKLISDSCVSEKQSHIQSLFSHRLHHPSVRLFVFLAILM